MSCTCFSAHLDNPEDPSTWIAILLGGFVLIYLSVLRPMMRKRKDPLERPPARTGLAQQRAVERDMQHLLVEYEKMIRNMTAGAGHAGGQLEPLIREADEKIAAHAAGEASALAGRGRFGATRRPPRRSGRCSTPAGIDRDIGGPARRRGLRARRPGPVSPRTSPGAWVSRTGKSS